MIRRILITVCLVALLCSMSYAGEPNDVVVPSVPGVTLWGQMDNSVERLVGLRAGYETDFKVEIGGTALWRHKTGDVWDTTPDLGGVYVAYWIDEIGFVSDSDGFSGLEDLLHLLVAQPYMLLEGLYDDVQNDVVAGIGVGTAFYAKEDKKQSLALTLEYMTIESYEQKFSLGLRVKF